MSAPITITGRLGADPELTFAASGMAITKMRVVTDRRVKEGDEWKSVDTSWHHVTAFKDAAEGAAEELRKGDLVIVVGTLKQREYETREGEKRSVWEVTANHVGRDLSRARKSGGPSGNQPFDRTNTSLPGDPWSTPAQPEQGDIPF
jgi:single-strand DNA-binding protein